MEDKPARERRKGTPRAWVARQMRLPLIIAAISCTVAQAAETSQPPKSRINSRAQGLRIVVQEGDWGSGRKSAIETVLYSVADELLARLPNRLDAPITVSHTRNGPIALYERGPKGEYQIRLHASGENWHLYAYEFAHELCHIISNYELNAPAENSVKYNQWFEETLCETASLYALKGLAERWRETPPGPEWADVAHKFERFYDHLISEGHRQLPPHTPLHNWLVENEGALRENPYLRDKNDVIANLLLPLFRENPQNWASLNYLNLSSSDVKSSLKDYLRRWYDEAPIEHRQFIGSVLALFGLEETAPGLPDKQGDRLMVAHAGVAKPE